MSFRLDTWTAAVASALAAHASAVRQTAARQWSFAVSDAGALTVAARLTPEWLLFDAPLPSSLAAVDFDAEVLAINAAPAPGVRLCIAEGDTRLRLRAELPLLEEMPIARRVERLCDGMAAAERGLASRAVDGVVHTAGETAQLSSAADCDLQRLCGETGWAYTPRDGGAVMIELDVPGSFRQAMLDHWRVGGVVVSVPVLAEMPSSTACARAVVRFMLALTGAVRMVSAAATDGIDFSVRFEQPPAAEELTHALAALSIACRFGSREVGILARDEHIARLYLAACGEQRTDEEVNAHTT